MIDVYEVFCVIGGAVVTFVGGFGYTLNIIGKEKLKTTDWQRRWNQADNEVRELNKAVENEKASKQRYKQAFEELAAEHNELKEKHAPFASLNPFEQQAVSAMTDQSVYNEWLNGAPKEGKQ